MTSSTKVPFSWWYLSMFSIRMAFKTQKFLFKNYLCEVVWKFNLINLFLMSEARINYPHGSTINF